MDLISLAVSLIVIIAIAAVVYWFVNQSGVSIPKPFVIVLYAVVAIAAILFLARFAGFGGTVVRI